MCEDYPCCGHQPGTCTEETRPRSDAEQRHLEQHAMCDHEVGICERER